MFPLLLELSMELRPIAAMTLTMPMAKHAATNAFIFPSYNEIILRWILPRRGTLVTPSRKARTPFASAILCHAFWP